MNGDIVESKIKTWLRQCPKHAQKNVENDIVRRNQEVSDHDYG